MNYFFHRSDDDEFGDDERAIGREIWRRPHSSYGHVRPGHPEGEWDRDDHVDAEDVIDD